MKSANAAQIWGLTGGIASGKSSAAKFFAELGIPVLDADAVSRKLSAPGGVAHAEIISRFGQVDRESLRELIFRDASARADLENILHPHIQRESTRELERLARETGAKVLIYEATLLVETGRYRDFAGLILVEAPRDLRKKRLLSRSRCSEEMAEQILLAQAARISSEEQRKAANIIVENSGTLEDLRAKVLAIARAQRWRGSFSR